MIKRHIVGVGTPTGQEINRSNPGFNQQTTAGQITDPNLGLRYSRKTVNTIDLDLAVALNAQTFKQNGTFIYYAVALDNSNTALFDRPIQIQFDRNSAPLVRFLPGMMISGFPFDTLYITNPAYTAGDVGQLIIMVDTPDDRILVQ